MTGPSNGDRFTASADALGEVARRVEGTVTREEDLAARQRFLLALGEPRRSAFRPAWALAFAVAAVGAVIGVVVLRTPRVDYQVVGAVTAREGWLDVPSGGSAAALRFSEGTEIELGPGSSGKVSEATAAGARVTLGSGALHARVVHRAGTRWDVEAGPYDIEVTGTAFDVDWASGEERLELSLHDGSVLVHGPKLAPGVRVAAGQRLVASARTGGAEITSLFQPEVAAPAPAVVSPVPPAAVPDTSAVPGGTQGASPPPSAEPSWSELVSSGNFRAVLDAANARGIEQTLGHGSLRDLVALSDAARYAGDRALARRGLEAERTRFSSSPESHAAAFVLGRMADDGGALGDARKWYEQYLSEAPHGSLAAEALGRRLVVLVKQGNVALSRESAEAYLARYPKGAHATYAREVLARK